jgi:hypothetical protein
MDFDVAMFSTQIVFEGHRVSDAALRIIYEANQYRTI